MDYTIDECPDPSGSSGPGIAKEGQERQRQPPQCDVPPDSSFRSALKLRGAD